MHLPPGSFQDITSRDSNTCNWSLTRWRGFGSWPSLSCNWQRCRAKHQVRLKDWWDGEVVFNLNGPRHDWTWDHTMKANFDHLCILFLVAAAVVAITLAGADSSAFDFLEVLWKKSKISQKKHGVILGSLDHRLLINLIHPKPWLYLIPEAKFRPKQFCSQFSGSS